MNSRKLLLSALVIILFLGYVGYKKNLFESDEARAIRLITESASQTDTTYVTATTTDSTSGLFKDGEYIGDATDAYYGIVQVKATIASGKLTAVQFLEFPNDRDTSRQISSIAMPRLTEAALGAQSSKVDIVSGATETSIAFTQSLASALAQAK